MQSVLPPATKLLLGVSGGADSMALWHWLSQQGYEVIACYINHHQRPEENQREIQVIQQFGEQLGSRVIVKEISPTELAERHGNFQNFARERRYEIWQQLLVDEQLQYLALAHHSDDLLETVLMRLVRGTSPLGLVPFQAQEQRAEGYCLLRPFYAWTKAEIYEYCYHQQIPFCEDSSNQKDDYLRNRYRHHIIPQLQAENPQVSKQVRHFVDQLQQIDDYLMNEATKIAAQTVVQHKNYLRVSINPLKNKPMALQSAVFKIILRYVSSHEHVSLREEVFRRLFQMLEKTSGSEQFHWQQYVFERNYDQLFVYRREDFMDTVQPVQVESTHVFGSYTIQCVDEPRTPNHDNLLYPKSLRSQLIIRTLQPGDVIAFRQGQHKKVARLFIDAKIPRFLRNKWPIVEYQGKIIWVYKLWQASDIFAEQAKTATLIIEEE